MFVLAIVLRGFYVDAASGAENEALVLYREKKVLDANAEARSRGIQVGMSLAEARAILAEDGRIVAWEEEPYREAQRRWLEIVAEYSDIVEPIRQHEALADLSGHPRPREAAAKLEASLVREGCDPRLGLAACRWVARLAARRGDPLGLAHADPESYVSNVPVSQLPLLPATARRLDLLGYRTAGETSRLTVDTLRTQFGQEAHRVAQAAKGRGDTTVKALYPQDAVAARFMFDGIPKRWEEFDAGLGKIAAAIGTALRDRDAMGRTVELLIEHEDASVTKLVRTFASSIVDEPQVKNALGLMFPQVLPCPVASIRARLPELKTARRVQLDTSGGRSRADQTESVQIALEHVRGVYGNGAVRLVSEIKESRRVRVRRAYQRVNGYVWG